MQIFLLILFGFLSGIIGGMGMGGGTLLVPLLSFLDLEQRTIQAINLISFIPMCCVALGFHAKNKLIKPKGIWWIVIPAALTAIGGAFCATVADNKILRWSFAVFLIVVGVWQLIVAIKFIVNNRKADRLEATTNPASTECVIADDAGKSDD